MFVTWNAKLIVFFEKVIPKNNLFLKKVNNVLSINNLR